MEFERRLYLIQVCSPSVHEYGLSYISGDFFFFFSFKKRFSLIKLELSQKEKKKVIQFELKWRFL